MTLPLSHLLSAAAATTRIVVGVARARWFSEHDPGPAGTTGNHEPPLDSVVHGGAGDGLRDMEPPIRNKNSNPPPMQDYFFRNHQSR